MSRFGLAGFPMAAILIFFKGHISAVRRAIEQKIETLHQIYKMKNKKVKKNKNKKLIN